MPNRIIREGWIDSLAIDSLDSASERFFLRLCLKADDYGRYHAHPQLIKSTLFPLKDDVRSADIPRWLAACEKAGLLRCYEVADKAYTEIIKFDQRTRAKTSKFPAPDKLLPVPCRTDDSHPRTETYSETETKSDAETDATEVAPNVKTPKSDEEWLDDLANDPAYKGIVVKTEYGKMQRWCQVNHKQSSRRRFVNWINRIDRPMDGLGSGTSQQGGFEA